MSSNDALDPSFKTEQGQIVSFSLDGQDYEIRLGHDEAARLRDIFACYIGFARPVDTTRQAARRRRLNGRA